MAVGDINGDGLKDLVDTALSMSFLTSNGMFDQELQLEDSGTAQPSNYYGFPAIGDVNGDGLIDVVVNIPGLGNNVSLYLQDSLGMFPETKLPNSSEAFDGIVVEDLDGDGHDDILFTHHQDDPITGPTTIDVRLGDGAGGFERIEQVSAKLNGRSLHDLDGDGDLDLGPPIVRSARFPSGQAGSRKQFGLATPGTGGVAPTLGAVGPFRTGETMQTRLVGGRGGALAVLFVGGPPTLTPDWPAPGLESYTGMNAVPFLTVLDGSPTVPGSGNARWNGVIPAVLQDVTLTLQAFIQDPGVVPWIVQTNGMVVTFR